jgi:predicted Zn-dependent protease
MKLTRSAVHEKMIGVMARRSNILSTACLLFAITSAAPAQQSSTGSQAGVATQMSNVPIHNKAGAGVSLTLSVFDEKMAPLDRQAMVGLYDENTKAPNWQPTSEASAATFDVGLGKHEFDVNAVGYLTGHTEIDVISLLQPVTAKVVLHPDPDAVELNAADASTPAKASKKVKRAVSDLKSRRLKEAQKHLESALNQAPASAHVNFLLGYLCFQQNDLGRAQTYLNRATTLDPHDVQALNLLGGLHLAQRDYAAAQTSLEQAVAANPENAPAHSLLADAYLNQHDFKNALAQADLAIEKGQGVVSNAQIVRGEALGDMGRNDEAIQALKSYLQKASDTASAPQVRQLIATLEQRGSSTSSSTAQPAKQ